MKRLALITVFLFATACDRTVTLSYVADPSLLAQGRPVCMGTEVNRDCADQNDQRDQVWNICVWGCQSDCDLGDSNCYNFCAGGGTPQPCGPRPDPEDCRVDVVVDPVVGECAAYGQVKSCSTTYPCGLGTVTLVQPRACNATVESSWRCGACNFQNLQSDSLGRQTFFCPRSPEDTWSEDCIIQNDGDVLSRP